MNNEKYTGVFVFNRLASKDCRGKRNGNALKPLDQMVRIEGGCPAIVSKKLFQKVQRRSVAKKRNAGQYHSKEFYLMTGKMICGVCGKRMQGNLRFSGRNKARLATYRCPTHRKICKNKELNKDYLDAYIAVMIAEKIMNPSALRKAVTKVNQHIRMYNKDYDANHAAIAEQYNTVTENLDNITAAIEKGVLTESIIQRAETLETEKAQLESRLQSMQILEPIAYQDVSYLLTEWKSLQHNTEEFRSFAQQFIHEIKVYPYHFEILLDIGLGVVTGLMQTVSMRRGELYELFESRVYE